VGDPGEEIPDISTLQSVALAARSEEAPSAPAPQKKAAASSGKPGRVRATPRAKKMAKEMGIDLSTITGTGPGGRITEDDIKAGGGAAPKKQKLSSMRRVIAENMTRSSQEAPHFYLSMEIDMTDAVALREKLKAKTKISYNDMIIKACAMGLAEMPNVNGTWLGDGIGLRESVGVGLAVAVDDGLMVPVVRDADKKALADIAKESAELIEKTRSKKLTPDEYGNGSMTVSNLGMLGIDSFIPVINPGESVILGVGRIQGRAVVVDGAVQVRRMMTVNLSCDHRVVDGAMGGEFLGRVRELLEKPEEL
jgi:pyruvate dehydrogenase E2 component (dihydrolipoamide acetyltransferase)